MDNYGPTIKRYIEVAPNQRIPAYNDIYPNEFKIPGRLKHQEMMESMSFDYTRPIKIPYFKVQYEFYCKNSKARWTVVYKALLVETAPITMNLITGRINYGTAKLRTVNVLSSSQKSKGWKRKLQAKAKIVSIENYHD